MALFIMKKLDKSDLYQIQTLINKGEWLDKVENPFTIAALDIWSEWIDCAESDNQASAAWDFFQSVESHVDYLYELAMELKTIGKFSPGEDFKGPVVRYHRYACPKHNTSVIIPALPTEKTVKKEVNEDD